MVESAEPGARERKRRETRRRIADAGVRLFSINGYEATTVDAIAAEAGISRRTFFHYFQSKDDVLLSFESGLGEQLAAAIGEQVASGQPPLAAMRAAMSSLVARYSTPDLIAIDRLMRASTAVQARKQANYIRDEATVYEALRRGWPDEGETSLRLVAMLSIGMSRLSLDAWSRDGGTRPLADYLAATFDGLEQVCRVVGAS